MKKKASPRKAPNGLRPEYDFSKGVRGKYASLYRRGTNVIVLDPDVARQFKTSREVNRALRSLLKTGLGPNRP